MQNYICTNCNNKIYFENVRCLRCGLEVGFEPNGLTMIALVPHGQDGSYRSARRKSTRTYRYCSNAQHAACNWLTDADDPTGLCRACDLNRTIPNLNEFGSLSAWQDIERAKKRLVYALLRLGLAIDATALGQGKLTFDFVRHAQIGHQDGVITIDVLEADTVERERQKQLFDEPYRSLLGHLRHESGHFYWKLLVEGGGRLSAFRSLFGDERADYGAAIQMYYAQGPRFDWQSNFVSSYASAHPWEDWAETWAHYLHIVSAVDTSEAEGLDPRMAGLMFGAVWRFKKVDVYRDESFESLMDRWIPLSLGMNSLSRCMGHGDFYPFVTPAAAYTKLEFVHDAIRAGRSVQAPE